MRNFCGLTLTLTIALLGSGCTSTHRTAYVPNAAAPLGETQALVAAAHPEIEADINESNITAFTGGGLIFALVDAGINTSRSKKAVNRITPLRDALADHEAAVEFADALRSAFEPGAPLLLKTVDPIAPLSPKELAGKAADMQADAVLLLSLQYRLDAGCSRIETQVEARMATPKSAKPLYRNLFATYRDLPTDARGDQDSNIALWAADNGALARSALQAAFAELARMVVFDLPRGVEANQVARAAWDASAPAPRAPGFPPNLMMRGQKVSEDETRMWVRLSTGELSSVDL